MLRSGGTECCFEGDDPLPPPADPSDTDDVEECGVCPGSDESSDVLREEETVLDEEDGGSDASGRGDAKAACGGVRTDDDEGWRCGGGGLCIATRACC